MTAVWTVEAVAHGLAQPPNTRTCEELINAGAMAVTTDLALCTLHLRFAIAGDMLPDVMSRAAEEAAALFARADPAVRLVDLRVRDSAVPTDDSHLMGYGRLGLYLGVSRQRAAKIAKTYSDQLKPYAYRDGYPLYTPEAVDTFLQGWDRKSGRPKSV